MIRSDGCLICSSPLKKNATRFCSAICYGSSRKGIKRPAHVLSAISAANTGRPLSKKHRNDISETKRIKDWKKLSYGGVHCRIRADYGRASFCQRLLCNGESRSIEWANLDGKYNPMDRDNWAMLCQSCHWQYDNDKIALTLLTV